MAFKFLRPVVAKGSVETNDGKFSFKSWYIKNRARLNEKKAKRYREDSAYREAILTRSKAQRELRKKKNQEKKLALDKLQGKV